VVESQKLKEQLDHARTEQELAERRGDLNKAAELRYGTIPNLERQLAEAGEGGAKLVNQAVTEEDIAAVVSRWTGIPVEKMLEGERAKLIRMEDELRRRVVGQEEALEAVSKACAAPAPACRIPTGRSAPSCSSAPPASARPSW
jgi:ATP-dependent Clp protease ATP-binding subunit ClpB